MAKRLKKRDGDHGARDYTHSKCGSETTVTEDNLTAICNPLCFVEATFCANCKDMDALSEFTWSDTGETLVDFRERMTTLVPRFWWKFYEISYLIQFGIGILVGACFAYFASTIGWKIGGAIGGFLLGFVVVTVLVSRLIRPYYKIDFQSYR